MFLEIYELNSAPFLIAPRLAQPAALKTTKVKLDQYVINGRKRYQRYRTIYQHTKANKKCMKDYDKSKESSYLHYWDVNNLYGFACK